MPLKINGQDVASVYVNDDGIGPIAVPETPFASPKTAPAKGNFAVARSLKLATGRSPLTDPAVRPQTTVPNAVVATGGAAIELGLGFRLCEGQTGTITGVRFWRAAGETGTTTVRLWKESDSSLLGTATATNPGAGQWNEALFATPIAVVGDTNYVVSYTANSVYAALNAGAENVMQDGSLQSLINNNGGVYNTTAGAFPGTKLGSFYYLSPIFVPQNNQIVGRSHTFSHPVFIESLKDGEWNWRIPNSSRATNNEVCGYADRDSLSPGETINFKIYSNAAPDQIKIEILRLGWYGGAGARVYHTTTITSSAANTTTPVKDATTRKISYNWQNSFTYTIPSDWISGVYIARLTQVTSGKKSEIGFVVRSDSQESDILVVCAFDDYYAYNTFGFLAAERIGLYDFLSFNNQRAFKVSKNRPMEAYTYRPTSSERVTNYESTVIRWLERMGYRISYCVNEDVSVGRVKPHRYRVTLDCGHNEYWTQEYREALEIALTKGQNLVFLGANTGYWRIRYEDPDGFGGYRTIVCYKNNKAAGNGGDGTVTDWATARSNDAAELAQPTFRWRDKEIKRPEHQLLGGGIIGNANYAGFPWAPTNLSDPLFINTGFNPGENLAGGNGLEWDLSHPIYRPALKPGTAFRILAESPAPDKTYETDEGANWWLPATNTLLAQSTYYESPSGGKVFGLGSCSGARLLDSTETFAVLFGQADNMNSLCRSSDKFQKLFNNILDDMKVWGTFTSPAQQIIVSNTQTLFSNATPVVLDQSDGSGSSADYELGTVFRVDVAGNVTHLRYYQATSETGTHIGRLWRVGTGQQLGSVTFTTSGGAGWKEQALATPIALTPGVDYLVSVNANTNYAFTSNALQNAVSNGRNLTAIANGGRFNETISALPATGTASNYFRDVIFVAS